MTVRLLSAASALAIACVAAVPASAAPLLFNFSGPSGTAMFQLDSNPTPDFSSSFIGADQFGFNNVAGTFGGVAGTASTISFGTSFYAALSINAPNLGFTQFSAPVLFSGPPAAPTFLTGTFTLINPFFGNGTLVISPVPASAVPEPGAWAMMLIGFGAIGAIMRYRRRSTTIAFA